MKLTISKIQVTAFSWETNILICNYKLRESIITCTGCINHLALELDAQWELQRGELN